MQKPDTGKLIKLVIKEPTDKEFEAFKKDFLTKQAQKTMGSKVKGTIGKFLYKIGELESERDELKDKLSKCNQPLPEDFKKALKELRRQRGKLLNDALFYELKLGLLYQ